MDRKKREAQFSSQIVKTYTLGQTVIKYDNLLDKALALNREAQIYVAGLPLRWDKPEINDSILNLNAYLEHKSNKLGRINYINNNIFTRCRKTHYSIDKLHLNNQGKDLMALKVEKFSHIQEHSPEFMNNFPDNHVPENSECHRVSIYCLGTFAE